MSKDNVGLGEARDDEQEQFSSDLLQQIKEKKGIAKISYWTHKGDPQTHVYEVIVHEGGMELYGPNPPTGYYENNRIFGYFDFSRSIPRISNKELEELGWD